MVISDAFERYCTDYIAMRNQSAKTAYNHRTALNSLISFTGDIDVEQLTFNQIRDWKKAVDKKCKPTTVAKYVISLRVLLNWLQLKGYKVVSPDAIPVPLAAPSIPKYILPEEVAFLTSAAGQPRRGYPKINRVRNQLIIAFLYGSGIREHELCQIDRDQIKNDSFTIMGKRRTPRLCFIDSRTKTLLEEYLSLRNDSNPALILSSQTGTRITTHVIQEVMRRVSEMSGIKVNGHTLRHSFATDLLKNNANMRYVQVLLGHKSLQTTQKYTHVVDSELQEIHSKYHTI